MQFKADWRTNGGNGSSLAVHYRQTIVRSIYYLILRFLHFTDINRNGVGSTDDSHDRLWEMRDLFEIL